MKNPIKYIERLQNKLGKCNVTEDDAYYITCPYCFNHYIKNENSRSAVQCQYCKGEAAKAKKLQDIWHDILERDNGMYCFNWLKSMTPTERKVLYLAVTGYIRFELGRRIRAVDKE